MLRPLLLLSFLAALLFTLIVGGVRAGSQPDPALPTVFTPPDGCAAPCWAGIRPGETLADEAEAVLRAHPWVADINRASTHISWHWNGQQPPYLNPDSAGLIYLTGQRVVTLRLVLTTRFGDVWTLLGPPDSALLVRPVSRTTAYLMLDYAPNAFSLIASVGCPARPGSTWGSELVLHMGEPLFTEAMNGSPYNIFRLGGWWRWMSDCRRIEAR